MALDICFHELIGVSDALIDECDVADSFRCLSEKNVTQFVHECIKQLPRDQRPDGVFGLLDQPHKRRFKLPRAHQVPEQIVAPTTKWEKFSKDRGLVKTKKNARIYDPTDHSYKLRYGPYSAKNLQKKTASNGIHEFKKNEDPFSDPFQAASDLKSISKAKQTIRQVRNKVYNAGYRLDQPNQKKPTKTSRKHTVDDDAADTPPRKKTNNKKNNNTKTKKAGKRSSFKGK